jgi:hypothetical protein
MSEKEVMNERIIKDMKKAQLLMNVSNVSLVVIKDGEVLHKRTGKGVAPFIDLIESTSADFSDCVIGDRLLGRASAFLCRYVEAVGVYAVTGTKKALAVLMVGGMMAQVDNFIPYISNQTQDGLCPFERAVSIAESPSEAFELIKKKLAVLKQ